MAQSPTASTCSSERTISPQFENPNPNPPLSQQLVLYKSPQIPDSTQSCSSTPQQRKQRTKSPGIRVVGGRIYDSENGKTCHQCRQKTMDFVVACKSSREDKPCTMKFCHKCLINRYGEKAEVASQLEEWKCPKCRGICNCSHCMKKRGYQPTGSLLYTAKQTGFRTVLEMLTANGPEKIVTSLKKENSYDGEDYSMACQLALTPQSDGKKIKEYKWIKLEDIYTDNNVMEGIKVEEVNEEHMINERDYGGQEERKIRKTKWKELARARSNGHVGEGTKEDGAQLEKISEMNTKADGAQLEKISEMNTKADGAQLEKIPGIL